jgi:hypothetical protein
MTDNIELDNPWINATISAVITNPAGDKTYLYILSDLESGRPDRVLSANHPDLATSPTAEPPLFQYEVGLGMITAVCIVIICAWERVVNQSTVEYL